MQKLETTDSHQLTSAQRAWRWRVFIAGWLAYAGFYLCRKNLSVAMPFIRDDLGYSKTDFAEVIFGYNLFYMLGQFGNGALADRFGARGIVGLGIMLAAFSNIGMGFAATLGAFTALNCLNGYMQATGWPGLVKIMSTWTRLSERGILMAWWSTNYVVGGVVASLLATWCASNTRLFPSLGWHRAFFVPAIVLALVGLAFIAYVRNRPSDVGLPEIADEELPHDRDDIAAIDDPDMEERKTVSAMREALAQSAVWITGIMYFFVKLTRYSLLFWLPTYMVEHLHYSKAVAGYASSCYDFVGFGGVIAAGYLSDKVFQTRRFPVGALMLLALAAAFLLQIHLVGAGIFANTLGFALIGFLTFGPDSLMSGAAAMDMGSKRGAATVAGIINGMGSSGQLFSSYLVAWVAKQYGWDSLFYLFALFSFIGGALLLTKWNYGGRPVAA